MLARPGVGVIDPEVVLETERLVLEPLRVGHAAEMFELLADERLYRFIPQDPPVSLEALELRFGRLETRRPRVGDDVWLNWVARLRADGACIARVEVTVRPNATASLAYETAANLWRRGFATEACGRAIRFLFENGVREIVAEVDTRNAASIRLLERLGFTRTGLKVDADHFKGATSDEYTYALARPAGEPQ